MWSPQLAVLTSLLLLPSVLPEPPAACPDKDTRIPELNKRQLDAEFFPNATLRLHIFPQLELSCSGYLTGWRFLVKNITTIRGLHLAIFRQMALYDFDLVAETAIDGLEVPRRNTWITFESRPPLYVEKGDVVGFYYDSLDSAIKPVIFTRETLTGPMTIEVNRIGMDLAHSAKVNVEGKLRTYQFPALVAILHGGPGSAKYPTPSPVPESVPEIVAPVRMFKRFYNQLDVDRPSLAIPAKCLNPPVQTTFCAGIRLRAFFDFTQATCRAFFGCQSDDPDANNFANTQDCMHVCVNQAPSPGEPPMQASKAIDVACTLNPAKGAFCFAPEPRFYFEPVDQTCYSYSGCEAPGGNNFGSFEECSTRCGLPPPSRANSTAVYPGGTRGEAFKPPKIHWAVGDAVQPTYLMTANYQPEIRSRQAVVKRLPTNKNAEYIFFNNRGPASHEFMSPPNDHLATMGPLPQFTPMQFVERSVFPNLGPQSTRKKPTQTPIRAMSSPWHQPNSLWTPGYHPL